jgi:hypothetical protein
VASPSDFLGDVADDEICPRALNPVLDIIYDSRSKSDCVLEVSSLFLGKVYDGL